MQISHHEICIRVVWMADICICYNLYSLIRRFLAHVTTDRDRSRRQCTTSHGNLGSWVTENHALAHDLRCYIYRFEQRPNSSLTNDQACIQTSITTAMASPTPKETLDKLYPIPGPAEIQLAPTPKPGTTAEAQKTLVRLLKDNQERHHIFFNDKGFHK